MAERKAVNKYYPPDWDPQKGSVNKRVGQHPLRDRAKKLSQGILVIRFELPYNIWCGGCGSHVGMGVRYNAEKSKVGNYYTTPIYKFRMKCHLCDNYFEIQTDPKNHDYVILNGARRKEQRWDPVANEQIVPEDKATQKKMAMDAMYKLEHGSDDKVKGKEKVKNLAELESSRFSMKEDYLLNRMARDKFRGEKRLLKEAADADRSILERGALDIELLEETESDRNLAGLLKYTVTSSYEDKQKERRKFIEQRPLFEPLKSTSTTISSSTPSSSSTKSQDNHDSNEDSTHKLSEMIRLHGKDPFAISKPAKLFSTSTSKPSALGVHLKHSRVVKRKVGKKAVLNSIKNDEDCTIPVVSPTNTVNSSSFGNFSNLQTTDAFAKVTNEEILLDTAGTDNQTFEHDSKMESGANSELPVSCDNQNTLLSSTVNNSRLLNSHNASGLSLLMSSYDEDKDSDSCCSD